MTELLNRKTTNVNKMLHFWHVKKLRLSLSYDKVVLEKLTMKKQDRDCKIKSLMLNKEFGWVTLVKCFFKATLLKISVLLSDIIKKVLFRVWFTQATSLTKQIVHVEPHRMPDINQHLPQIQELMWWQWCCAVWYKAVVNSTPWNRNSSLNAERL